MVGEFGGATARKDGDDMAARNEIVFFAELTAIFSGSNGANERVADEFGGDSGVTKKLLFEGEDTEGFFESPGDELGAPGPPGPELRANVVDIANATRFEFARKAKMETREIGEYGDRRFALRGGSDEVVHGTKKGGKMFEDFRDADDGDLLVIHDDFDAGSAHQWATHSE